MLEQMFEVTTTCFHAAAHTDVCAAVKVG